MKSNADNFKSFNDMTENMLNFYRSLPASLEIVTNLKNIGMECEVYDGPDFNGSNATDFYYCYMCCVFDNFLKKCSKKSECVRCAFNAIKTGDLLYEIDLIDQKLYLAKQISDLKSNARGSIEKDLEIVMEEIKTAKKDLESKISLFLIKSGCIDEFFQKSHETDNERTELIFTNCDVISRNLPELQYETLLLLRELIKKYEDTKILDINDTKNIQLNILKEIYLYGGCDVIDSISFNETTDYQNLSDEECSQKLIELLKQAAPIQELSPKDFYKHVEETVNKVKKANKGNLNKTDAYPYYKELIEIYNRQEKARSVFKTAKELDEKLLDEIKKREDDYIKRLLVLSNDCSEEEKENLIIKFFKQGYEIANANDVTSYDVTKQIEIRKMEFNNCENGDSLIQNCYRKISANKKLVNQIAAGEYLFNKFEKANINNELNADYTFLVASQMKAVERFIKESILKNLVGCKFYDFSYKKPHCTLINGQKDLDDLNSNEIADKTLRKAELGKLNTFLSECWSPSMYPEYVDGYKYKIFNDGIENQQYSIFQKLSSSKSDNTDFYDNFVSKIRNGHFHTSLIRTISDAKYFRNETAFWLLCVIKELKGL